VLADENPKTTPAHEMGRAIYGQLEPYRGKARKLWEELGALLGEGKDLEGEAGQGGKVRPASSRVMSTALNKASVSPHGYALPPVIVGAEQA
jgi:hypothetical protein